MAGTVQHAHGLVTQRALGYGTARCLARQPGLPRQRSQAPGHGGKSGLQPVEREVYQISVNLWSKESRPGAGSLTKSRHHWNQCGARWFRR